MTIKRNLIIDLPDQAELDRLISRLRQANQPLEPFQNGYLLYDPSQNGVLLTAELGA